MKLLDTLRNNPLVVKHVRTRLRPHQVGPAVAIVLMLCGGLYYMLTEQSVEDGSGFLALVILQGILLFLAGSSQIASALAHARETGMLDSQRISLQSPGALLAGYLFGPPVREWMLFGCTLPFSIAIVARGWPPPGAFLVMMAVILSAALLYQSAAMLAALVMGRARVAGALVVTLVVALNLLAGNAHGAEAALTIGPTAREVLGHAGQQIQETTFFGLKVSAAVLALIHQLPLLVFVLVPVWRRLRREISPLYSKLGVVAFQAAIAALLLGDVWDRTTVPHLPQMVVLYCLMFSGILLATAVTPDRAALLETCLTAGNSQLTTHNSQLRKWQDTSANGTCLLGLAVIVLIAGIVAPAPPGAALAQRLLPALTAACVVLYVGSARQFVAIRFGGLGQQVLWLALAGFWVLPAVLSGLLATRAAADESLRQGVASLSPLFGISLGLGGGQTDITYLAGGIGLATSAALALLAALAANREAARALIRAAGGSAR